MARRPALITGILFAVAAHAQVADVCKGPAAIEQAIQAGPSGPAWNALGAYFGKRGQLDCAVRAFEKALALEPGSIDARYNLALALLQQNDRERAIGELQSLLTRKPDLVVAHNALATAYEDSGDSGKAEAEFRAVLRLDPKNGYALDRLAAILLGQKRFRAAAALLEQAPATEVLRTDLAIAYSGDGQPDKALAVLRGLVKAQPRSAVAHFNLATEYARQKRFRDSVPEYREVLRLDAGNDSARDGLIRALDVLAEYSEALPVATDYAARKPSDFDAVYLLGEIQRGLERYPEAAASFEKAVRLRPGDYDAQFNLGTVLVRMGKAAEARAHLETAARLRPNSADAHFQLAAAWRALNQPDRAAGELKAFQALKQQSLDSDSAAGVAARANRDLESGKAGTAIESYREALKLDPNNARTHFNLALALARSGDAAGERGELEAAAQLDATLADVQTRLGMLDLAGGHPAEAEVRLKAALSSNPQSAEAQNGLGVIRGQEGRADEAERLFRQAIENNPGYGQAYVNLALILAGAGRLKEAGQEIGKATRADPLNPGAFSAQGMIEARLGHAGKAVESFRQEVILEPKSPLAHLNLGMALNEVFDLRGALTEFSQAVVLDPRSAAAHYRKGRVLFDLHRLDEARPELEEASRLAPGDSASLYLQAMTAKLKKDYSRSAELARQAIARNARDADAHFLLAENLIQLSSPDEAIPHLQAAAELNPNRGDALELLSKMAAQYRPSETAAYGQRFEAFLHQAHIASRAGALAAFARSAVEGHDWPQAIARFKEAIQKCGACATRARLHQELGLTYLRTGAVREGIRELRLANPADMDVQNALRMAAALEGAP